MWSIQRKLANHKSGTKTLREIIVKVLEDEVENRLILVLKNAAKNDKSLGHAEVLRRFAFDTICKMPLGMDHLCLDLSRPTPPLSAAFNSTSKISAMCGTMLVFAVWKLKRVLNVGLDKELRDVVKLVCSCVDEMIQSKKEMINKNSEGDLLSRFLEAGFDNEMVRDMVIIFLMAGRDTTPPP